MNRQSPVSTDLAVSGGERLASSASRWLRSAWTAGRFHLLVIALYTLIMIAFTWPLALHLTDQSLRGYDYVIPGVPFDRDQFIWDMWWVKKALFDFQINPYHTTYLYYPYGVDLYLQSLTPVNGLMGTFFYGWLNGWLGAYNAVVLLIFVWCGHSAFLLADYLVRDKLIAFVAGFFFTLSPQHYFNLHHAQLNVITLQFFPLFVLYMLKLDDLPLRKPPPGGSQPVDQPKIENSATLYTNRRWWLYTVLAALFLVLSTISDQYLLLFGLIIMGLYYLWRGLPLLLKQKWAEIRGLLGRTLPALVLAGVVMLPWLYATWRTINSGKWAKISNDAVPMDFSTLIFPPVSNIFIGAQGSEWGRNFFIQPEPRTYSIGLVGLGIAIYGIVRAKEARWWGLLLGVSVVLALGAEVRWYNQSTGIPMPGKWLNELPIFEVMRYSKRWIGPASLAIAVASAYALKYQFSRLKPSTERNLRLKKFGLVMAVLAIFTFEVEPWPVALSGDLATLPKAYANQVLPKTDRRAILELPFYQKYTAKANEMYWQTAHERPIVGGYISRIYNFDYNDTPLAYFVDGYRPDQPDFLKPDLAGLRGLLAYADFGYIAIYKFKLASSEVERWRQIFGEILGSATKPYYEDEQLIFYQLPDRATVLATARPTLLRGSGWSAAEKRPDNTYYRWIIGPQATLPLFMPSIGGNPKLEFQAASYFRDRTVEVLVNGQAITQLKVTPALQIYQIPIDLPRLKPGDNLITLRPLEPPDRPSDHDPKSNDTRPLTILVTNVTYNYTGL